MATTCWPPSARSGPRALSLADEAGEQAPRVMRLLSRHGGDAARVFSQPKAMGLLARYGDDAAEALIKHDGIAESLVESLGEPALKALGALGDRGGRRLAMMAKGELATIGRTRELLGVIAKHGDPAMDFVWRHKTVLAGGMALTAFLANPEPYLNGTYHLAGTVGENLVKPVVVAAGNVAQEAAGFLRWNVTILVCGIAAGLFVAVRNGALEKPWVRAAAQAAGESLSKHAAGLFGASKALPSTRGAACRRLSSLTLPSASNRAMFLPGQGVKHLSRDAMDGHCRYVAGQNTDVPHFHGVNP